MTAKVWVTQETNLNFMPAEKFGEIRFLAREDVSNIQKSLHNEKLVTHIRGGLAEYDNDNDFIVIAGSPYVAALVFLMLGREGYRSVKVLRWDNRSFEYIPMMIEMRGTYRE